MTIPDDHVYNVCKIGQGADCCAYLTMSGDFECAKTNPTIRGVIESRLAAGELTARGDNCRGWGVAPLEPVPEHIAEARLRAEYAEAEARIPYQRRTL